MEKEQIRSFMPVIDENSKILILGSIPSVVSLQKQQYYGHPRNHFWPIIYQIFGAKLSGDYRERLSFLLGHKIALWDVLGRCYREGSLDASIREDKPNDLRKLIDQYPNLRFIGLNGRKAHLTFTKHFSDLEIEHGYLPSTSPVPGKNVLSLEEKMVVWERTLTPYL